MESVFSLSLFPNNGNFTNSVFLHTSPSNLLSQSLFSNSLNIPEVLQISASFHERRSTTKRPNPTRHTTKKPHTTKRPRPTKSHRPSKRPTKSHRPCTSKRPSTTKHPAPAPTKPPPTNSTKPPPTTASSVVYTLDMTWDDATWILLNSFFIFQMQLGFGLLEAGIVSEKNVANILMKNTVDIIFGGITYWAYGFSLSYGASPGSNGFAGVGEYAVDSDYPTLGPVMVQFFFQLSFATTATTIVSGTVAERVNFSAYCLFSLLNTFTYSIACKWVWGAGGWLKKLGVIDIAGSGCVHLLGGTSGYFAAWMLGPRLGRYDTDKPPPLGNPVWCFWGCFILWWEWLAFNAGSTFGVTGNLWKFAARAAVTTLIASFGGGVTGTLWSLARKGHYFEVLDLINGILGGLVGVTGGCALYHTFDALIIGLIGGAVTLTCSGFADWTGVDDPVGATAVHAFGGIWGMVAVGLFADHDGGAGFSRGNAGVFRGGTLYLLVIQLLACVSIIAWAATTTVILLVIVSFIFRLRLEPYEELLGADYTEHLIRKRFVGITPAESAFASNAHLKDIQKRSVVVGFVNPAHEKILKAFDDLNALKRWKKRDAKIKPQVEVPENGAVEDKLEEPIKDTVILVSVPVEEEAQEIAEPNSSDAVKNDKKKKWTIADMRTKFRSIWRRKKVEGEGKVETDMEEKENLEAGQARYPTFIPV